MYFLRLGFSFLPELLNLCEWLWMFSRWDICLDLVAEKEKMNPRIISLGMLFKFLFSLGMFWHVNIV